MLIDLEALPLPRCYPRCEHSKLYELAFKYFEAHGTVELVRAEFRTALSAVAYRCAICSESGRSFAASVAQYGAGPPLAERYGQERDFFVFVMSGMATLECVHYCYYAIGSALYPGLFSLASKKDRRDVSASRTVKAFRAAPESEIARQLAEVQNSKEYSTLKALRIVLFHRSLPGRDLIVGGGPSRYQPFEDAKGVIVEGEWMIELVEWQSKRLRCLFDAGIAALIRRL